MSRPPNHDQVSANFYATDRRRRLKALRHAESPKWASIKKWTISSVAMIVCLSVVWNLMIESRVDDVNDVNDVNFYGIWDEVPGDESLKREVAANPTIIRYFESSITDEGLKELKKLTRIQEIDFGHNFSFTDAGLVHLKNLKTLRALTIRSDKITNDGLRFLSNLTNLESLIIGGKFISDAGMVHLQNLTRLKKLDLYSININIGDGGLKNMQISNMKELEFLNLPPDERITDDGVKLLQGLHKLKFLRLSSPHITDRSLKYLNEIEALEMLYLGGTRWTASELENLQNHTKLKKPYHSRSKRFKSVGDEEPFQLKASSYRFR